MNISIFFLIQLLVSLAAGGYVAYRIKDKLVAIVLRLMPMRYKISENSVYLHGRIATVLTLVVILLTGSLTYYGIHRASQAWETTSSQSLVELTPPKPKPARPRIEHSLTPIPRDTVEYTTIPTHYENLEEPSASVRHRTPVLTPAHAERYYLQIGAFSHQQKAIRQRDTENKKGKIQCIVGVQSMDAIPYKLLLGPFSSRYDATTYLRKHRIKGYPKAAEQIDHFLRPATHSPF